MHRQRRRAPGDFPDTDSRVWGNPNRLVILELSGFVTFAKADSEYCRACAHHAIGGFAGFRGPRRFIPSHLAGIRQELLNRDIKNDGARPELHYRGKVS